MARSESNGVATFAGGGLAASVTFVAFAAMPKFVAVMLAIGIVGLVGALWWKKKLRGQWLGVMLWVAGAAGLAGVVAFSAP